MVRVTGKLPERAPQVMVAVAASTALGIAIPTRPMLVAILAALTIALLGAALASKYPAPVFVVLVVLMAMVPTYAAPSVGPFLMIPAAGAAWLLAAALVCRRALLREPLIRLTAVDAAVGVFALLMAVSVAFSVRGELADYLNLVLYWGGPFLAARLLLRDVTRPALVVAVSFAVAILIIAPIAVLEASGVSNPFENLTFNDAESSVWVEQGSRFGQPRAEASFGHPIALSMFASISALLSLAMAVNAERASVRGAWLAAAAVAVGVQALTLSRTGWVIIAVGIVLLALITAAGPARRRLVMILAALAVLATSMSAITPPEQLTVLPGTTTDGSSELRNSSDYRQELLKRALEPGVLQAWGNPVNSVAPDRAVSTDTGSDNAYILLADTWGLIPMAAFVLILVTLGAALVRSRGVPSTSALPVVALAGLAALFFVAFITQQQLMIWLLIGAAGAAAERGRMPSVQAATPSLPVLGARVSPRRGLVGPHTLD